MEPPVDVSGQLADAGYAGPTRVLTPGVARRLGWRLRVGQRTWAVGAAWPKDRATRSAAFHRIASDPRILDLVEDAIGPDIVVWGASVQVRRPGQGHRWHTDVETAGTSGRTISVWLPLHQPGPSSSLLVIPGSHRLAQTVQRIAAEDGLDPDDLGGDTLVAAAGRLGLSTEVARLTPGAGDAVLFDGDLWHASVNEEGRSRAALLLQYATPATPVRLPVAGRYDWPFPDDGRRPPAVLVRGRADAGAGTLAAPPGGRGGRLAPRVEPLAPADGPAPWRTRLLFSGRTATGLSMTAHVSALTRGHTPHPPHAHPEEELLVVLGGELAVDLVDRHGTRRVSLGRGDLVHYPLDGTHTVTALTDAHYVVLKWDRSRIRPKGGGRLGALVARRTDGPEARSVPSNPGWRQATLFEGATAYLAMLHAHRSVMAPGAGYPPHADAYDVAILTLDGSIETLGRPVGPDHLVWYPMGCRHGLVNPGRDDADYLVIEFHGANVGSRLNPHRIRHGARRLVGLPVRALRRLAGPRRRRGRRS